MQWNETDVAPLEEKVLAVIYYAENDAYIPLSAK